MRSIALSRSFFGHLYFFHSCGCAGRNDADPFRDGSSTDRNFETTELASPVSADGDAHGKGHVSS